MNPIIHYIESQLQDMYDAAECRELAFWIVEETTGMNHFDVSTCKDTINIPNIEIILSRLRKKEPIQYIFSHTKWYGLDLSLNQDTLIPRPETAELVDWVLADYPNRQLSVLDIGCGSGCIALACCQERTNWKVSGVDISAEAIRCAQYNAERNHLTARFDEEDILHPSDKLQHSHYDIVISNPPYIMESEKISMTSNVLDYEPHRALFVQDSDPLLFYRQIAKLRLADVVYFEINEQLPIQMHEMLSQLGYQDITIKHDIYDKARMVRARIAR